MTHRIVALVCLFAARTQATPLKDDPAYKSCMGNRACTNLDIENAELSGTIPTSLGSKTGLTSM